MTMHEFHVPAMTCGHCVRAVTDAVKTVDPQAQVDVDLPSHTVKVQTQQPREAVARALAEADYPPA
jgi:copper chaperone